MSSHSNPNSSKLNALWLAPAVLALGVVSIAQAQSASPFANQKKRQAWEQAPKPQPHTQPQQQQDRQIYVAPPPQAAPTYTPPQGGTYQAPSAPDNMAPAPTAGTQSYSAPTGATYDAPQTGAYFPKNTAPAANTQVQSGGHMSKPAYGGYSNQGYVSPAPTQSSGPYGAQSYTQNNPQAYNAPQPMRRRSWTEKLGFGNLATSFSGFLKVGAAVVDRDTVVDDGQGAEFIGNGRLSAEVSAITENGLEYGIGGEVRAQYDKFRRGFGGRVGDCPAGVPGCSSTVVAGLPTALRGHTSQFYADGVSDAKDFEVALEGAYLFLRSAYGDVTVGRDDGAAYLFSLGAPTLVAVGASNSPVDYTGLDSVKTINDASGFSEKISYVTPRLLGDQIGVGIQAGVSYSPNARACGVDYCVRRNGRDGTGTLAPDLENVIEAGLSLDRTFANGFSIEATGTYATAKEKSGLAEFDDLKSLGLGLELGYGDWTLGGSYLDSNNGLQDGDYSAYDVGLTWKPAAWGVTVGYGHAKDDNVNLESDQALLGFSYDFGNYRLGTGVQYIERTTPYNTGGILVPTKEKAGVAFIEGSITF